MPNFHLTIISCRVINQRFFFSEKYVKDGSFKEYMILRGNVIAEYRICNERNIFGFVLFSIAKNQVSRG